MLDQGHGGWDQSAAPPRRPPSSREARQRREARLRRKRKQRNRVITFWTFFSIFLLGLGYGVYNGVGWAQDKFGPKDFAAGDRTTTTVDVRIPSGAGGWDMGAALVEAGVVKTAEGFVGAFDANGGQQIQPGTWRLFTKMQSVDVVTALLDRAKCPAQNATPPCRVVNSVTIPEGLITTQIFPKLAEATSVPVEDFKTAAADPVALGVSPDWFAARPGGGQVIKSVEGFLFPATYDFDGGMTATEILKVMVSTFNDVTKDLKFTDNAKALGYTPYEVLITASIIQAEAVFPEDFPKVARVLYNRAFNQAPHCDKCLGLDSTINYWLRVSGREATSSDHILASDIADASNPYNTYIIHGMPPGAIGNPGKATMQAALAPATSSDVFFISIDTAGHMGYAATDSGFCSILRTANHNGLNLQLPANC